MIVPAAERRSATISREAAARRRPLDVDPWPLLCGARPGDHGFHTVVEQQISSRSNCRREPASRDTDATGDGEHRPGTAAGYDARTSPSGAGATSGNDCSRTPRATASAPATREADGGAATPGIPAHGHTASAAPTSERVDTGHRGPSCAVTEHRFAAATANN